MDMQDLLAIIRAWPALNNRDQALDLAIAGFAVLATCKVLSLLGRGGVRCISGLAKGLEWLALSPGRLAGTLRTWLAPEPTPIGQAILTALERDPARRVFGDIRCGACIVTSTGGILVGSSSTINDLLTRGEVKKIIQLAAKIKARLVQDDRLREEGLLLERLAVQSEVELGPLASEDSINEPAKEEKITNPVTMSIRTPDSQAHVCREGNSAKPLCR